MITCRKNKCFNIETLFGCCFLSSPKLTHPKVARGGVQVCEAGLHAAAGTADGNLTLLELSDNLVQCSRYILYPSHVNFPPLPVITVTKNNLNLRIKAKHVKDEADATVFVWFVCLHIPLHLLHPARIFLMKRF